MEKIDLFVPLYDKRRECKRCLEDINSFLKQYTQDNIKDFGEDLKIIVSSCYCKQHYPFNSRGELRTKKELNSLKISSQERKKILSEFSGFCNICNNKIKKTNIDHCHKTGNIRGVLCRNCNFGLGYFKDNIDFLSNAIKYLNKQK